jgi:hypothetical protein
MPTPDPDRRAIPARFCDNGTGNLGKMATIPGEYKINERLFARPRRCDEKALANRVEWAHGETMHIGSIGARRLAEQGGA